MKKIILTILAVIFAQGYLPTPAFAQDTLPSLGAPPSGTDSPVFVPAESAAMGTMASPIAGTASASTQSGLMGNAKDPQIVKDAITGLQKIDSINLDDMIRAQDAINRLDLFLEIEKRQLELKKIRDERNKPPVSLSSAIPSRALSLPAANPRPPRNPSSDDEDSESPSSYRSSSSSNLDKYTIQRITGVEGRYMAVLSYGDKTETVKSGEKLSDGTMVKSVSLTSVHLAKGKKSKTLTLPSDSYIMRGSAGE